MIKAILFDNDGVIVDSEPLHQQAEKQTMAEFGVQITEADFIDYVGIGAKKMFGDWIAKYNINIAVEVLIPAHEKNLIKIFQENVVPTPNVVKFIQQLVKENYLLAVASSSARALVEVGLKKYDLLRYFRAVVCGDEVEQTKPAPDIFLRAAEKLDVLPEHCLVIEDSNAGIRAAKAAGMQSAGYQNENSGKQDLSLADVVIADFFELDLPL